jgi:hypothetical protein
MRLLASASSRMGLTAITDAIHDEWFDIDSIRYDPASATLGVRFQSSKPPKVLEIRRVSSYELVDTEKIGLYDVNRVSCDSSEQTLAIETNIPLGFSIRVSAIDVRVLSS